MIKFEDRNQAGKQLAKRLKMYVNNKNVIVLALPRGGIPVAYQTARSLKVLFDIYLVRKLGVPGYPELAMGAVTLDSEVLNHEIIVGMHVSEQQIEQVRALEQFELKRRNCLYRHNRPIPNFKNKIVIIVDDGMATGATMRAAVMSLRQKMAQKIVIAVPLLPKELLASFSQLADEVVYIYAPQPFYSVGFWYESFPQLTDQEVFHYLQAAKANHLLLPA